MPTSAARIGRLRGAHGRLDAIAAPLRQCDVMRTLLLVAIVVAAVTS
jgi:hypothetical protein